MSKVKPKYDQISDIHVDTIDSLREKGEFAAIALYISAKGTKHFYESLAFLASLYPSQYKEEFEKLDKKVNH